MSIAPTPQPFSSSVGAACLSVGSWRASFCCAHALEQNRLQKLRRSAMSIAATPLALHQAP